MKDSSEKTSEKKLLNQNIGLHMTKHFQSVEQQLSWPVQKSPDLKLYLKEHSLTDSDKQMVETLKAVSDRTKRTNREYCWTHMTLQFTQSGRPTLVIIPILLYFPSNTNSTIWCLMAVVTSVCLVHLALYIFCLPISKVFPVTANPLANYLKMWTLD